MSTHQTHTCACERPARGGDARRLRSPSDLATALRERRESRLHRTTN